MKLADGRHLHDDQMIAVFAGAKSRLRHPDAALAHLNACAECNSRYVALADQLAALGQAANAEADAVFTPDRLDAQRAQILARLEHAGQPARVIQFPARGNQSLSIFTGNQVRRWIAAAAAAGLLIGVSVGRLTDFRPSGEPALRTSPVAGATYRPRAQYPRPVEVRPTVQTDDEVMSNLDRPLYLQPVGELEALDAMTPRPTQVALRIR